MPTPPVELITPPPKEKETPFRKKRNQCVEALRQLKEERDVDNFRLERIYFILFREG
jgi:hypothetical protein